jgi:nephrocystin-3
MSPSRPQIRAFLSSTFSDFLEERSLLVKQVFPSLRRKAKDRGVEVVEVDLRWGITEEQSKQGQTIGICLDEIERCRPYFIGLLGDRYGWVPEKTDYRPELLRRQDWLPQHQGNASVTELEILHGVLNNPEMAGRAFFYFRDPVYSDAKAAEGPGWRSEGPEERQKLEQLKQRIRDSGFPVMEGLATPEAIAKQIEADLWSLIEEQYPDAPKSDALELEAARHASYRADRTGLYLGGEVYITQLQDWISADEQRILITGDSGAGKSALIANWVAAHESSQPDDVIFCHHLGSSNDASALRPLLARMVDSASTLLADELSEPLKVPQDWWELVTQVTNTLSQLSVWANRQQRRWIWVLDGLDKLDLDDQQALPWLPLVLPKGVHLVTSALDCPVRTLLQERIYATLTIGPLGEAEREQLIHKYLKLYTKELVPALRQKITGHRQGSSPLFLRVLLEELRLCGRFETLAEQLQGYLAAESVADLYELVLQRLEDDGHGDAVRKVMTALWASRAGLSENKLLAITGLVQAQWAPIGIGLQEALSKANGRLVFGHDYLRQAVRDRYLPLEEQRILAHSELVDWFEALTIWDEQKAEELPWQLVQSDNFSCLRELLSGIETLEKLATYLKPREIIACWRFCMVSPRDTLDAAIGKSIEIEIKKRSWNAQTLCQFATLISELLEEDQLYHALLLRLRAVSLEATRENKKMKPIDFRNSTIGTDSDLPRLLNFNKDRYSLDSPTIYTRHELKMLDCLANAYFQSGRYSVAQNLYVDSVHGWQNLCGWESIETHSALSGLAKSCSKNGMTDWAEVMHGKSLRLIRNLKGKDNPATIKVMLGMAINYTRMGKHRNSEQLNRRCYQALCRIRGSMHQDTLTALNNLGASLAKQGKYDDAIKSYQICTDSQLQAFGAESPRYLSALSRLNKIKELNNKARHNSG